MTAERHGMAMATTPLAGTGTAPPPQGSVEHAGRPSALVGLPR